MLTGHITQQICLKVCSPVADQEFPWFKVTQNFLSLLKKLRCPVQNHENMQSILA